VAHECLTAEGPRIRCRTGHPLAVSGSREPSQMIEFVFSASPETIRNEPPEHCPFAQSASAGPGSLRVHVSRCFGFSIIRKSSYAAAVRLNSSAGTKSWFLRSTASM